MSKDVGVRKGHESGGGSAASRHPATSAVWEWLEHGDGATKPEPIRRAARERIEEIDRTFIEWDADFAQAEEEVARDNH